MYNNPLGKVLSKSSLKEFEFVSSGFFEGNYVQLGAKYSKDKETIIVGEVLTKEGINPYLENPSTFNYLKETDESTSSWNLYLIKVKPIAAIEDGVPRAVNFPAPPGTNVFLADADMVSVALGLQKEGASIGFLKQLRNVRVHLSEAELCRTHFSILGRTGSGKSYFAKGLLRNIKDRRLIIFAPTDEYNEIAKELGAQVVAKESLSLPLDISYLASVYNLTLQEQTTLDQLFRSESAIQEKDTFSNQEIAQMLSSASRLRWKEREQARLPGMESISVRSDETERVDRFLGNVLSKIRSKSLIFSKAPLKVPFSKNTIIDMSELEQEAQEVIVMYVLNNLLQSYKNEKKRKNYPNLIVAIEEVHNFAPSVQTTACKSKIIQTSREGRKLGIGLCLITQRPRHFDQTVLSQCGSLFLFHIPHPEDVEHVFGTSPVYRKELLDAVRELTVGECLVLGDVARYPIVCTVKF